jgi:hypothetical protein
VSLVKTIDTTAGRRRCVKPAARLTHEGRQRVNKKAAPRVPCFLPLPLTPTCRDDERSAEHSKDEITEKRNAWPGPGLPLERGYLVPREM